MCLKQGLVVLKAIEAVEFSTNFLLERKIALSFIMSQHRRTRELFQLIRSRLSLLLKLSSTSSCLCLITLLLQVTARNLDRKESLKAELSMANSSFLSNLLINWALSAVKSITSPKCLNKRGNSGSTHSLNSEIWRKSSRWNRSSSIYLKRNMVNKRG